MIHELKCWPEPFEAMWTDRKRSEIRTESDRTFAVGDILWLREYKPDTQSYTGRSRTIAVTHIERGPDWGLPAGLVVMSINIPRSVSVPGMP